MKNKKRNGKLDSFFGITERGSNKRIEIFAGIITFLAMAYILIVNPNNIFWGGTADSRFSFVFIATALGAFIVLQNAHIITANQFTLIQLIDFNNPELWHKGE